ncbi:hypothetical protein Ahy_B10g100582 isoform F [Arachis hypogaea]|uniref:Transcription factor MYC/MYB N-terminal domain-containing protein n=1 Tax=Arachis hypogaea TaxID=3818 RepID=A0A444WX98_ARAHY|nr:hypothetical protein Ahy_B10g100582 isoform F [Arachis hypogaea]
MLLENFKEQLALSVRSIQWSYAIFWVLSWGEGYYNGDIKTRKTSQGVELNFDQIGLQRSEQLRESQPSNQKAFSSTVSGGSHRYRMELKARGINNKHTLAYQSRVGPVQWLKPYTHETLVELGQKGVRSLLAVPVR